MPRPFILTATAFSLRRLLLLMLVLVICVTTAFYSGPHVRFMRRGSQRRFLEQQNNQNDENDDDEIDISTEDWRAFRAKLVVGQQQGSKEESSSTSQLPNESDLDGIGSIFESIPGIIQQNSSPNVQQWAYESVIEQGAVVLGGVEQSFGFGLRQQYFHKAMILVLEHSNQFTKGIILNRPTDMYLDMDDKWRVWYGGDVQGLTWDNPEIFCLHSLQNDEATKASTTVMNSIQWTTFEKAKELVNRELASPTDFWVFAGYSGWDPGQLQQELGRNSWYLVSTDSQTLLQELGRQRSQSDPRGAGLETWNMLMSMIGKSDTVKFYSQGNNFDDLMLKEWAREHLLSTKRGGGGKALLSSRPKSSTRPLNKFVWSFKPDRDVGEGSLVRASSSTRSPFLLSYQELHKSLVLILADDNEMSIGIILNRPTTQGFEIKTKDVKTGQETAAIIPLRFGGEYAIQGDQVLWLHCSPVLREAGVGTQVGTRSNVWKCSMKEVTDAIESGVGSPTDFLAFTGVTAWTKGNPLSTVDGIQGEVRNGNFELVPSGAIEKVWSTLTEQSVLNERNMIQNLAIARKAWTCAAPDGSDDSRARETLVFNSDVTVDELADDALQSWVSAHLLGIGLGDSI